MQNEQISKHFSLMTHRIPRNPYERQSALNKYIHQQPIINTPIHRRHKASRFHHNRLKQKENTRTIDQWNKKSHTKQQKLFKREKHQFNNTAYCIAYCTIIIIGKLMYNHKNLSKQIKGVTVGGWIGGLSEFIFSNSNGCTSKKYQGNLKCLNKYGTRNVTTHCINVFHTNSISKNSPYICLCHLRNYSHVKFRDCEFLDAKIQYI